MLTHGIPIPQVDQMPAGLIDVFLLARQVLREGRDSFTREERAIVELSRYRCFLLGLPEELLADTPREINDVMLARAATLRAGFEDATCGALVRPTMAADLSNGSSALSRLEARVERSFAKLFFVQNFVDNDRPAAARVGIELTAVDYAWAAATMLWITSHVQACSLAERIPNVRDLADARLVHKLERQLARFGHAEYATHGESSRPPMQPAEASSRSNRARPTLDARARCARAGCRCGQARGPRDVRVGV